MSLSSMRFARRAAAIILMLPLSSCLAGGGGAPESRRGDVLDTIHGVEIADPYRWLEDLESAEVDAWIEAQQGYTRRVLASAPPAEDLRQRLAELYRSDATFAPLRRGGRTFFARRPADREVPLLYVRRRPNADDELLVETTEAAAGPPSIDYAGVSSDGSIAAYAARRAGDDEAEIRFVDVASGEQWASRRGLMKGAFYDRHTDDGPRVFHHVFGTEVSDDRIVFGREYGPESRITSSLSSNDRYLLLTVHHGSGAGRNELYFIDTWTGSQVHTIVNDIDAAFEGHVAGDVLFVLTDWNAPNRRVFAANLRRPAADSWTEIIPEGDAPIESLTATGGRLLVQQLRELQPYLRVYEPDGFPVRELTFDEIGALETIGGGTWETDEVFLSFSSLTGSSKIYAYRVSDGDLRTWAVNDPPVGEVEFEISRQTYAAADGATVPLFLAHRRGVPGDGPRPAVLTGFGGFGVSMQPGLDRLALAWMERGGVWAIAGVRGGGELGADWHRAGMRENKGQAVRDFIAAAEWLIDGQYTQADRLGIRGTTHGGLLVAAALTQRPDLFAAAVSRFPLADMIRYELPVAARPWIPEYGSTADRLQFEALLGYSPYHAVERGVRYPSIMVVSATGDQGLAAFHAYKTVAALQAASGSSDPVVLLHDDATGPHGHRPVSAEIDGLADELRFLLWRTR